MITAVVVLCVSALIATARADIIATDQGGDLLAAATWAGDDLPGVGDTGVITGGFTITTDSGNVFEADELQLTDGTLRTTLAGSDPLMVNDLVLNTGGRLWGFGSSSTKVVVGGALTLNGGILESRNQNNRTLKIEAGSVDGAGVITVNTEGNFLGNSIDIDSPDMTGFTGTFVVDGGVDNSEAFDIIQDILPANASFGIEMVQSLFRLTGDVAVTSLIVDGDPALAPGMYDFATLSGLGYSAFFSDEGGTISVVSAAASVPEPTSIAILSMLLLGMAGSLRGRKSRA
jgi:hypothetical protein